MTSNSTIESLPRDVLLHVFSFLPPAFLCETVARVCSSWGGLCNDPVLYTTLEFEGGDDVSTETAMKLLRRASKLEKLTLYDRTDMEPILEVLCEHNHTTIRSLGMAIVREPLGVDSSVMKKIVLKCSELQSLICFGCIMKNSNFFNNLCLHLPQLKTLRLDLLGIDFPVSAVSNFVEMCNFNLENLVIFDKIVCSSSDFDTICIALINRFRTTIRSLRIGNGVWSSATFAEVRNCDHLETLSITEPRSMSHEGLMTITSIPTLRHLEFLGCTLPEAIWIRLFTSEAFTNLLWLDIFFCDNVTDDVCVQAIGVHLPSLERIALHGNLGDVPVLTARGVRSVIQGCPKLVELWLCRLKHTMDEVIQLLPEHLPGLRKLYVAPSADEAVALIKTRMPGLQIIEDGPYRPYHIVLEDAY